MAENKKQVLITIGAALSNSFGSVISGSTSKLKGLGNAIKELEKNSLVSASSIDKLKTQYNSLLSSMNKRQAAIQKRGFYRSQIMEMVALGAALAAPIRSAMKFEDSLAQIKAVVNFPTPTSLQKLGNELNKLSLSVPVAADELATVASIGGRFGVPLKDLMTFTRETTKTAVAWRANTKDTAERVGNLMKVFNVSTSQLPKYFDAINDLGNKTGATADQILQAVNRSSDGLSNFKLSIPQVAALTSTIISFGDGAEQAGTAVGTMLPKLSIAPQLGENAKRALRSIGMSTVTLPKLIQQDPQKALDQLFSGLAKLNPENRASALYNIFGRGAAKSVGKIVDNLALYRKNLKYVSDEKSFKGSRDVDYNIVSDTAQSQLTLFGNNMASLGRKIGESLLPNLTKLLNILNGVLVPITNWMEKNKELTSIITTTVAGIIGFRIALFALGYASTFLVSGFHTLLAGLKALRIGFNLLGIAIKGCGGWITAIITAAWLIYENWDTIKEYMMKIWVEVEPYWNKFTEFIVQSWADVKKFFLDVWNGIISSLESLEAEIDELCITDNIMSAWTAVEDFFSDMWDMVAPYFDSVSKKMKEWGVTDVIITAWTHVEKFFVSITNGIIDAWNKVKKFFMEIWNEISPIINKITKPLSGLWEGAKSGLKKIGVTFDSDKQQNKKLNLSKDLKPANTNKITKNQNNNFNVTINAGSNDNAEIVANKVVNKIREHETSNLFDNAAEVI